MSDYESQDWRLPVVRNEPTTQAALDAWEPAPVFDDDLKVDGRRRYGPGHEDDFSEESYP